ncbi:unnamed protein product, partial [Trichobilharzia regenti]
TQAVLKSFPVKGNPCDFDYFYQTATYWVHTQGLPVNVGDIVLVEKADPPLALNTMYKLKKVEFPVGNLIDPVTGLRSEGPEYSIDALKTILSKHVCTTQQFALFSFMPDCQTRPLKVEDMKSPVS